MRPGHLGKERIVSRSVNGMPSNYLRTLRERAGFSQLELANLLGIHNTHISRLERRSPAELVGDRRLIIRFAEACHASPSDIELQLLLLGAGLAPWVPEDEETLLRVARYAAALMDPVPPLEMTTRPDGMRSWWFEPGLLTEEQARWLGGWGRAEADTYYPSERGARTKRLLRWRGRAKLPPFIGLSAGAAYRLIIEMESGVCDDTIALVANGRTVLRTDPREKVVVVYRLDLDRSLIGAEGRLELELVNLTAKCHTIDTAPIFVVELLRHDVIRS
jgi:transcriptional regulator with XRE-family HTH domain